MVRPMSSKSEKTAKNVGNPKVSIISTTYNQEKYIRQTLESFVCQKTDFDFEVVIADDCSTDRTAEIIEEYEKKYPNIFKANLRKKNIGAWQNYLAVLRAAKGDYIAICEGDDYWTDAQKLQKQADFLDGHPDYALCFHPVRVFFENNEEAEHIYPDITEKSEFTTLGLLKGNFIQTNSVMYRRQNYDHMPANIVPGDWYVHLYHAQFGKIGIINEIMSAYRRHPGGLWWDSHDNKQKFWERHGLAHMAMYSEVLKLYGENQDYSKVIYQHIVDAFGALAGLPDPSVLIKAIGQFPELAQKFLETQQAEIVRAKEQQQVSNNEINHLRRSIELQDNHIKNLENELSAVKNSRAWKAFQKVRIAETKLKRKQP
jgi:glycosyltransferase involved in cell wall biosynthesis